MVFILRFILRFPFDKHYLPKKIGNAIGINIGGVKV